MIRVWDYIRRYKLFLSALIVFSVVSSVSAIVVPYLNGMFIDVLISSASVDRIVRFAAVIISIGLLSAVASYFVNMSTAKLTAHTTFDMMSDSINHIQKIPYDTFTSK